MCLQPQACTERSGRLRGHYRRMRLCSSGIKRMERCIVLKRWLRRDPMCRLTASLLFPVQKWLTTASRLHVTAGVGKV